MNKFLKLLEENRPGEDKYTVELKDVNGKVMRRFAISGVGSPFENFLAFEDSVGGIEVPLIPVEDQEIQTGPEKYDVDREVNRLANQGGMFSGARGAKKAVKERQRVAKDAVSVFQKKTEELKQAIKDKATEQ